MESLKQIIATSVIEQNIINIVISNQKKKDENSYNKVSIKPFISGDKLMYQFAYVFAKKTTHKNIESSHLFEEIQAELNNNFKQAVIFTVSADYQILTNKDSIKILKQKPSKKPELILSHNKKKNYLISEGEPCEFLVRLGVMDEKGRVYNNKFDKFRQINKFLEIVSDTVSSFETKESLNIIDFGCGKAYLTFALYHYLVNTLGFKVNIAGLDLKEDVIDYCNSVASDLGWNTLKFFKGEIKNFDGFDSVDMVVTLHACDTATDDAIIKAVNWNTSVLLTVPCCQHELFNQLESNIMNPMLKHGLVKERLSSLITDSMRANILEIKGYSVQMLEFIDIEHTPKNIMIRAIKTNKSTEKAVSEYQVFKNFWNIKPYLEKQLL